VADRNVHAPSQPYLPIQRCPFSLVISAAALHSAQMSLRFRPIASVFFGLVCLWTSSTAAIEESATIQVERTERVVEGWTLEVDNRLLSGGEGELVGTQALALAAADLHRITRLVPESVLERLRTIRIVFDFNHGSLKPGQYHPSAKWLEDNGYSRDLAEKVHIPVAAGYADANHLFAQPAVLIHELAHAYHDQFLGWNHPDILKAYQMAKAKGQYESVLHIKGRPKRKHYALTNHKEYFAEGTEAMLYVNDFYPFVRAELQAHDLELFKILRRIWVDGEIPKAPANEKPAAAGGSGG